MIHFKSDVQKQICNKYFIIKKNKPLILNQFSENAGMVCFDNEEDANKFLASRKLGECQIKYYNKMTSTKIYHMIPINSGDMS